MPVLAIIIPAYSGVYLKKTLESLAVQTNKNFNVYIGNDGGDPAIEKTVAAFNQQLNITYQYFEDNMGSSSLVKQWERCFALTQNEQWLWLLPDDDYVDPNCVAIFYSHLQQHDFDLFRFNVKFVTADENIFKINAPLPSVQSSWDSMMEKLSFSRPSTVAEFIFRKERYAKIGFAEIPMAWGSDDLLWYQLGQPKGIHGCNDAYVYLRQSHLNISNNYSTLGESKIAANFIFFDQLLQIKTFFLELTDIKKKHQFSNIALKHIMYNLQDFYLKLSLKDICKYSMKAHRIWGGGMIRNMRWFWLNNQRINSKKTDD